MEDNEIIQDELPETIDGGEPEEEEAPQGNHMLQGMSIGLVAGCCAMTFLFAFAQVPIHWAMWCLPIGLVLGQLIGSFIPKKK